MELVEIIKGRETDAETLARAYDYVLQIGKTPIVVNDARGFYTSRTFGTFVMEGCAMLDEGIPAAVIENAALAAGMPVGPLAVLDETSLSLSVHVMEQTAADLAAEGKRYDRRPGEALVEMMVKEFKRPGRAAGGGFYDYPEGEKKKLWPGLKERFEKPGVTWDIAELKRPHPLPPGGRDAALPGTRACSRAGTTPTSARSSASVSRPGPAAPGASSRRRGWRPSVRGRASWR